VEAWMFEDGPLRWLLVHGRPEADKSLYLPYCAQFGDWPVSSFCVRYISGRPLHHNIDLKGMSTWDYLHLGVPSYVPVNCPFPHEDYFHEMTHDEDRILFGGPNLLDNLVFSQAMLDIEALEEQQLLEDIEDLQELVESGWSTRGDRQDLRDYKLRVTRLTKTVWQDDDHFYAPNY
jgi:hypothetical protein